MEIYFHPESGAVATREGILERFGRQGIDVRAVQEGEQWIVEILGTTAFVSFSEREGALTFATLDMSMLAEHDQSHAVFALLEDAGWESEEDVG